MNSVNLIGRLARDPEISYTPNTQTAVCRFTIAVDRPKRNGESQGADFIRIVVYGKQGENCNRYLKKGRQCGIVNGRIQTGSYQDRDTGKTVYTTDIIAGNVEFIGGGAQAGAANGQAPANGAQAQQAPAQATSNQQSFADLPGANANDFDQPVPDGADDWGDFSDFDDIP